MATEDKTEKFLETRRFIDADPRSTDFITTRVVVEGTRWLGLDASIELGGSSSGSALYLGMDVSEEDPDKTYYANVERVEGLIADLDKFVDAYSLAWERFKALKAEHGAVKATEGDVPTVA